MNSLGGSLGTFLRVRLRFPSSYFISFGSVEALRGDGQKNRKIGILRFVRLQNFAVWVSSIFTKTTLAVNSTTYLAA